MSYCFEWITVKQSTGIVWLILCIQQDVWQVGHLFFWDLANRKLNKISLNFTNFLDILLFSLSFSLSIIRRIYSLPFQQSPLLYFYLNPSSNQRETTYLTLVVTIYWVRFHSWQHNVTIICKMKIFDLGWFRKSMD